MKKHKLIDIPRWLSALILATLSIAIPIYLYIVNPAYLTSQHGYANGIEMYTHTIEAMQTKNLLQNMMTNFWFNGGSLGYPMFIKTQPLPCFVVAVVMLLLERLVSPLCVFRWIVVLLITLLPLSWYKAARIFRLSRIQSISVALLLLSIDSQLQVGLELDAYLLHGYLPQLFAMLILPIAASKIYIYGLKLNSRDQTEAVFYTCLSYLCHINVGFYCSLLSVLTMILYISANKLSRRQVKDAFKKIFKLHIFISIYLSWWIIPLFISYLYTHTRGTSDNIVSSLSLTGLVDLYTNGFLFGYRQKYQWTTLLVAIGLLVAMKNLKGLCNFNSLRLHQQQLFTTWLLMVTALSIFLSIETSLGNFLHAIMPCQLNSDPQLYLFGVHFCGVLFASFTVRLLVYVLLSFVTWRGLKRGLKICLVGLFSFVMIRSCVERVSERVTLVKVSEDFIKTLDSVKNISKDGRIIAHEKFGTGGPWDLVNIPYLTEKSGVFLPGGKDSASTFYLDSLLQSESCTIHQFHNLLNLYNVHFLVASSVAMDNHAIDLTDFKLINKIYDMRFYQVTGYKHNYNYFEIVRLPGYIKGKLKHIYQPVAETLDLFSKQVLFYINPREETKKGSIVNARVVDQSFVEKLSGNKELSLVHWNYGNDETNSEEALSSLHGYYGNKWTSSLIMEEKHIENEYHVIVHITGNEDTKFELREHLLLKVSFHPFWRCHYFPIDDNYLLEEYDPMIINEKRKPLHVDHVTPNLMSVTLPPGRYHVIFKYRFPGILKLLAIISSFILVDATFNKMRFTKNLLACCVSMYVSVLLVLVKAATSVYMLFYVTLTSVKRCRFHVFFPPVTKLLENKYETGMLPYITNVKMLVKIQNVLKKSVLYMYNDCMREIQGKFITKQVVAVDTAKGIRKDELFKKGLPQGVVEIGSEKVETKVVDASPSTPVKKHVKKSTRKKQMKRLTNEKTLVSSSHKSYSQTNPAVSDNLLPIPPQRSDFVGRTSKSGSDFCGGHTKNDSLSPVQDLVCTEDCYISDSYMYDISKDDDKGHSNNNSSDEDDDILLSSDIFRTTWIAEKEEDDEDLDLNKSLELSFSPLSSGSNTPSDYECNLSEFSSSPNEHSSLDDSIEYRKEFEHLEEITQNKKEIGRTRNLYEKYMSESTQAESLYTKRTCTLVPSDDKHFD